MATHDVFDMDQDERGDGIDGWNAFRESGDRENRVREERVGEEKERGSGERVSGERVSEERNYSNGSYEYGIGNAFRNSAAGKGSEEKKERNETFEQRRRSADKIHDDELSRSRGMQEYWKRLSERVANVGQKINRRITRALDNTQGAEGTEPDSSGMGDNGNDRLRKQENDPKPYRRIE